jgi:hypothetical protein
MVALLCLVLQEFHQPLFALLVAERVVVVPQLKVHLLIIPKVFIEEE